MNRYLHADANLYSHIRTLRVISLALLVALTISSVGWYSANRTQRISIPPDIRFGGVVPINAIQPWEVYNFTGYIWQQLNRCSQDCSKDYPKNLERLTAFISPTLKAWLKQESDNRLPELLNRTRYVLPTSNIDFQKSVIIESKNRWKVDLDVNLVEHIDGVPVKDTVIRFSFIVVYRRIDPESNPWGLLINAMARPPERLPVH